MLKKSLLYGLSLFAMFFGSGNLIYPIQVGIHAVQNWYWGYLGFLTTGVLLPYLGLYAMTLYQGSYHKFFGQVGKIAQTGIPLVTLSLLGSFGVMARCITVAYEGFRVINNRVPIGLFNLLFTALAFLFSIRGKIMFQIVGKWLTPTLLFFIVILLAWGMRALPSESLAVVATPQKSFQTGFIKGYNTMDLVASFFVTVLLFKEITLSSTTREKWSKEQYIMRAGLIGITLLALVYLGLTYLGASYSHAVGTLPPAQLLPVLARYIIGKRGGVLIAIIIILSCLTTTVALGKIYTQYLVDLLPMIRNHTTLVLLTVNLVAYLFSCLGFSGITKLLIPTLQIIYPALITLTILSLLVKNKKWLKIVFFYCTLVSMFVVQIIA
ncbi:MAG: branched-chain amino acid transport system II carrier protein [Bacteroidota bacterium]